MENIDQTRVPNHAGDRPASTHEPKSWTAPVEAPAWPHEVNLPAEITAMTAGCYPTNCNPHKQP